MAQLTYNSINKFRYYGCDSEGDLSKEETLRDSLLKQIINSQLKRNLNIEDCLKNKEKFVVAKKQSFSSKAKGLLSNDSFKNLCKEIDVQEILASCGLEDRELDILISGNESCVEKSTEEAYFQRLKHIEQKLVLRQNHLEDDKYEHFSGIIKLNRHEYEEECNKVCSLEAEKLSSCLIQLEPFSNPSLPHDHPINHLTDLEKSLFPLKETPLEVNAKKRKLNEKCDSLMVKYLDTKPKSFWDMKERPVIVASRETGDAKQPVTDVKLTGNTNVAKNMTRSNTTDYSKPFVWTLKPSELVPLENIANNRCPFDDIPNNPKFKNYRPGTPSQILYLKNLPHNILPIALVALFGHFEKDNGCTIQYRILKGKMRGQAFIKFKNKEISEKAFNICNGYILEGKPIVIEFGKKCG